MIQKPQTRTPLFCGLLFFILTGTICHAQQSSIVKPSPEAAALARYVEIPVSYFNGNPNISIPLYEIVEGDISVPISISYHGSGLKVSEESGLIGLGWNINIGGEIIVGQRGKNDFSGSGVEYNAPLPSGNSDFDHANYSFSVREQAMYPADDGSQRNFYCSNNFDLFNIDGQRDLYMFNFGSYSGKFLFTRTWTNGTLKLTPEVIDRQKILFEKIPFSGPGSNLIGGNLRFKATTPDGFTYEFNEAEYSSNWSTNVGSSGISSYKLTAINSASGKRVTFNYGVLAGGNTWHSPSYSYIKRRRARKPYDFYEIYQGDSEVGGISETEVKYLQSVSFSTGVVEFKYSAADRLDILNGRRLNAIVVKDKAGVVKKTITFNSNVSSQDLYFNGNGSVGPTVSIPRDVNFVLSSAQSSKRLKLSNVKIDDAIYEFIYNPLELPGKTSNAVDYWGYYNGANSNITGLPHAFDLQRYYLVHEYFAAYEGANRNPDRKFMQASMLTAIKYPTGGITKFTFEPHRFSYGGMPNLATVEARDLNDNVNDKPISDPIVTISAAQGTVAVQGPIPTGEFPPLQTGRFYVAIQEFKNNAWSTMPGQLWDLYDYYNRYRNDYYGGIENGFYADASMGMWVLYKNINVDLSTGAGTYRLVAVYPDANGFNATYRSKISLQYYSAGGQVEEIEGGGLRIAKIEDIPGDGNKIARTFAYTGGVNLNMPRFTREIVPYALETSRFTNPFCNGRVDGFDVWLLADPAYLWKEDGADLSSSNVINNSNSANGSNVGYKNVIVEYVGKGRGKTEYTYRISSQKFISDINFNDKASPIGTPNSNELDNGLLLSQVGYRYSNNQYYPVKRTTNNYDVIQDKVVVWNFIPELQKFHTYDALWPTNNLWTEFGIHLYPVKMGRVPVSKTTEINYTEDGASTEQAISYTYNAAGFIKTTQEVNSSNQTIVKEYFYASDYTNLTSGHWIWKMKNGNFLQYPIEVIKKIDGKVVSADYTEYQFVGNVLAPSQTYRLVNTALINNFNLSSLSLDGSKDSRYDASPSITYVCDGVGNIVQTKTSSGISTAYYYGYNNSLSVLKADNTTFSELSQKVVTSLPSGYSSLEQLLTSITTFPNASWNTFNQNLRSNLTKAMITSYTYDPVIGLTSTSDSNNKFTYFEYDAAGRLEKLKDSDRNALMLYQYNYKK